MSRHLFWCEEGIAEALLSTSRMQIFYKTGAEPPPSATPSSFCWVLDTSQPKFVLSAPDSTHTLDVGTETTVADVKCAVQAAQGKAASVLSVLHGCAQTRQPFELCDSCTAEILRLMHC